GWIRSDGQGSARTAGARWAVVRPCPTARASLARTALGRAGLVCPVSAGGGVQGGEGVAGGGGVGGAGSEGVAGGGGEGLCVAVVEVEPVGDGGDADVFGVDPVMVVRTQRDALGQGGGAAVGPPFDVVDLAPRGAQVAVGPLAVAVAGEDGPAQLLGVGAFGASHVQGEAGGGQAGAGELTVAHEPFQLPDRAPCDVRS